MQRQKPPTGSNMEPSYDRWCMYQKRYNSPHDQKISDTNNLETKVRVKSIGQNRWGDTSAGSERWMAGTRHPAGDTSGLWEGSTQAHPVGEGFSRVDTGNWLPILVLSMPDLMQGPKERLKWIYRDMPTRPLPCTKKWSSHFQTVSIYLLSGNHDSQYK